MVGIVVVCIELSTPLEDILSMCRKDEDLLELIQDHKEFLIKEDIEIFEERDNLLITEIGYYMSFYDTEIEKL